MQDAPSSGGSGRREASNTTLALTIGYVRAHAGDEGVARLLELAGDDRPLNELLDERRWSTQDQKVRLFEAAATLLDDPHIGRHIGETVLDQQTGAALKVVLRTLGSPGGLLRSVAKASAKFSTNYTAEALSVGKNEAIISNRLHEGYVPSRLDCEYTAGLLSQAPVLFGLPAATVEHDECQVLGAPACIYRLRWRPRRLLLGRRGRSREDHLREQLDTLRQHYEALQSTVVDLVSPSDVDTVLARITRRASDAVRAQQFVLAVQHDDGELVVHHEGMARRDAVRLAGEILDAPAGDGDGDESRLIVDVASARCSYGRLAAICEPGHGFLPEDGRLLATYGRQAAVALDAATALEEARRRGETATTLLDLSRALATAVSVDDVARRLAEAVPAVVSCSRAAVLVWDHERRQLVVRGRSAEPATGVAFSASDDPEVAALLRTVEPRHVRIELLGDTPLRRVMEARGVSEIAVVPIARSTESDVQLIGAIAASRVAGDPPLMTEPALSERLAGLADQAAVAFERARLLEQEREALTRLRRDEQHIKYLAYHDPLTGLPNGRLFADALERALSDARENEEVLAVLFCDLDRFKNVNDSLGHVQGDHLLRLAAGRLASCVREGDTLARLGGDEFTLLLRRVSGPEEPEAVAERILRVFEDPFLLEGQEVFVSASIGVAVFPDDGRDAESLLKNADAAMYGAKSGGRNLLVRYTPVLNARARHLLALETDLHNALARHELVVHYQPSVDAATGTVEGVEALVRWRHPERGLVPPADFIPLAEETGLILALDEFVLRQACADVRAWDDAGLPQLTVAVNLSAHEFRRAGLVELVAGVLSGTGLDPSRLELEVTESAAMQHPTRVGRVLHELEALGVGLAVDDFGTGYSIFGHLKRFPVRRLKLDRSFVAGLPGDRHDRAIVTATVRMAHEIDIAVTAEGVERHAQAEYLVGVGCDSLQGFLHSPAVPATAIAARFGKRLRGPAEIESVAG